jgi:hypothetical protein
MILNQADFCQLFLLLTDNCEWSFLGLKMHGIVEKLFNIDGNDSVQ